MSKEKSEDLKKLVGKKVTVDLKGRSKIKGILDKFDDFLNVVLKDAVEYKDGESVNEYDVVLTKGGNIRSITG
ncbi:MAG: LSM domain-containing protein [Candidatus Hadarchaeia archaeon]